MSYAKHITQKKFRNGALLAARFPAGGSVSIAGSVMLPRTNAQDELADVHAQMLMEGTGALTKRELQAKLDAMGATLSFGIGDDRLVFAARVRTPHLNELVGLIAHILLEPSFPREELAVLKRRQEANLALAAQDTRGQARGALARMLYRKEHPNYEHTVPALRAALKKINTASLQTLHLKLSARGLVCAVAGDITASKAFNVMQKHFGPLPHGPARPVKPKPAAPGTGRTMVAHIKNKASIDYIVGVATGITNTHKDYPALLLGLTILGSPSGFTGRLMQIVRDKEGLTYAVYSYPTNFSGTVDGYAVVSASFAPQLFKKGRAAVLREIARIVKEGVTHEEVKKHQGAFEARSRVHLSDSRSLARTAHGTIAQGKKLGEIDAFPQRVLRLTAAEVNAALKKYLKPSRLCEAAAGPIEKF